MFFCLPVCIKLIHYFIYFLNLLLKATVKYSITLIQLLIAFLFSNCAISQLQLTGKVINARDGKPVSNATINISGKRFRQTDAVGNFRIPVPAYKSNDSLVISSVGFNTLKLPVSDAITKTEFGLNEQTTNLQLLILKSYLNEAASGSNSEVTGYFRSWKTTGTGGEIGKFFYINHDEYKLERVRFKVNNQCDTCQVRLHIREVIDDLPGDEILYDSITTEIKRLSFDDRFSEFDLSNYNLVFKQRSILVSLEVLHCTHSGASDCSFCFIGTEEGKYMYKTRRQYDWVESENDFSIYMRLIYKY
jgi:hypothetical protein